MDLYRRGAKHIDAERMGGQNYVGGGVIIIALVVNAASFFIVARRNKGVVDRSIRRTGTNETTTYLICGMMPSSAEPFDWLLDEDCPIKGGIHVVYYQNFGFNPRTVADQLGHDIRNKNRNAIFVTLSIGSEIPFMLDVRHRHIAISPCFGRQSLKRFSGIPCHIAMAVLEICVYALGWIAFLPLIKSGGARFSLALHADWLYWATANLGMKDYISVDGIITSSHDGIINNAWLNEHIEVRNENCRREIACGHCDIENFGLAYKANIASILQDIAQNH